MGADNYRQPRLRYLNRQSLWAIIIASNKTGRSQCRREFCKGVIKTVVPWQSLGIVWCDLGLGIVGEEHNVPNSHHQVMRPAVDKTNIKRRNSLREAFIVHSLSRAACLRLLLLTTNTRPQPMGTVARKAGLQHLLNSNAFEFTCRNGDSVSEHTWLADEFEPDAHAAVGRIEGSSRLKKSTTSTADFPCCFSRSLRRSWNSDSLFNCCACSSPWSSAAN